MAQRLISGESQPDDIDLSLRPSRLDDFVGQAHVKDNLSIAIQASKIRGEPLDHVVIYGPPGLGKTTLAHIIAHEMDSEIRVTSGPAIERAGDMAAILTGLQPGSVLFIDEIHRLHRVVEEVLYSAMEDFFLSWMVGKGLAARSVNLRISPFTLVGATTRFSLLSAPLRDRFGSVFRLEYYQPADMQIIVSRSARILEMEADLDGLEEIAFRSRGTPRIANRLLQRTRDYALVMADNRPGNGRRSPGWIETTKRGPIRLGSVGPPSVIESHRQIRRRTGGLGDLGSVDQRRLRYNHGRPGALPFTTWLLRPYAQGTDGHQGGL